MRYFKQKNHNKWNCIKYYLYHIIINLVFITYSIYFQGRAMIPSFIIFYGIIKIVENTFAYNWMRKYYQSIFERCYHNYKHQKTVNELYFFLKLHILKKIKIPQANIPIAPETNNRKNTTEDVMPLIVRY